MVELDARSPFDGLALPQGAALRCEALTGQAIHLFAPGRNDPRPQLPGPGRSDGPWLSIGPQEWLHLGPKADDAPAMTDLSDALTGLRLSGEGAIDLIAAGGRVDRAAFTPGSAMRMRLGEIAVVLRRVDDQTFDMFVSTPLLRYLLAWVAHHVEP